MRLSSETRLDSQISNLFLAVDALQKTTDFISRAAALQVYPPANEQTKTVRFFGTVLVYDEYKDEPQAYRLDRTEGEGIPSLCETPTRVRQFCMGSPHQEEHRQDRSHPEKSSPLCTEPLPHL